MKYITIVTSIIFLFVLYGCEDADNYSISSFKKLVKSNNKYPVYEIDFLDNKNKIVAKRNYQNGKTLLSIGKIPTKLSVCEIVFINEPQGKGIMFLKNSKIIAERRYDKGNFINKGEIPDGYVIEKYDNGKLNNIFIYKRGKRNGHAISIYKNENIKLEVTYINDKPVGIGRKYFESGVLMAEWEIVDGIEKYHKEYDFNGNEIIY